MKRERWKSERPLLPPRVRNWTKGTPQVGAFLRQGDGSTFELCNDTASKDQVVIVLLLLHFKDIPKPLMDAMREYIRKVTNGVLWGQQLIYEITNPSDPYTLVADDDKVAMAAVLLLGEGRYGLDREDHAYIMPPMFGPGTEEIEQWLKKNDLYPIGEFISSHRNEIAAALDSVLVGPRWQRHIVAMMLETLEDDRAKWEKARESHHDKNRGSTNDIGRRAWHIAESLRKEPGGE